MDVHIARSMLSARRGPRHAVAEPWGGPRTPARAPRVLGLLGVWEALIRAWR